MSADDEQLVFESAVREHVRGMTDDEFARFTAETRPPTTRRGAAGRAEADRRFGARKRQQ